MTAPGAIMIFAAGRGTRMGALTNDRPKPLVCIAGRPLIDHALDLVHDAGQLRCVVNTHYLADMVRDHLGGQDIAISHEDRLLETGGGLRHALPLLGSGPVYTLNSDAVWTGPNPLQALAAAWDPARMEALLLLLRPQDALGHGGRGDFLVDGDGRLQRGPGLIYSGAQIICTDGLGAIAETVFSLNLAWDAMMQRGTLYGVVHDGRWCDVGQPQSLALAEALIGGHDVFR